MTLENSEVHAAKPPLNERARFKRIPISLIRLGLSDSRDTHTTRTLCGPDADTLTALVLASRPPVLVPCDDGTYEPLINRDTLAWYRSNGWDALSGHERVFCVVDESGCLRTLGRDHMADLPDLLYGRLSIRREADLRRDLRTHQNLRVANSKGIDSLALMSAARTRGRTSA